MIKIRAYSDLHLDHYEGAFNHVTGEPVLWYPPDLPDDKETILILAGDLWTGTRFIEFAGFSWIGRVAPKFKQVLVVLGNHCYWPGNHSLTIKNGADKCNSELQDRGLFNVQVLDCSTYEVDDYIFVGATLWTDMDKRDPLTMLSLTTFMAYDGKISYETGPNVGRIAFSPSLWVQEHDRHKNYIGLVAGQNKDKKIIVITHHLPLLHLGDPRYQGHQSNAYYMSDLSDVILDHENIHAWFYGHTHHQMESVFPPYAGEGGCRMINNCVGYQGEHCEQLGLVKHKVIEL